LAGSDFSLSGCVHVGDEGKGDWKVLINKRPRVCYWNARPENSCHRRSCVLTVGLSITITTFG